MSFCISVCLSQCQPAFRSVYQSLCWSVCLSVPLFACLPTRVCPLGTAFCHPALSVCLFFMLLKTYKINIERPVVFCICTPIADILLELTVLLKDLNQHKRQTCSDGLTHSFSLVQEYPNIWILCYMRDICMTTATSHLFPLHACQEIESVKSEIYEPRQTQPVICSPIHRLTGPAIKPQVCTWPELTRMSLAWNNIYTEVNTPPWLHRTLITNRERNRAVHTYSVRGIQK